MSVFQEALVWLNDPWNWQGQQGIVQLLLDHLWMSLLATIGACAVSLPLGIVLARTRRGSNLTVIATNTSRAFPTLALLTIFAISPIGFGNRATVLAVAIFAVPPILTNVFVAMREVDPEILEAARGTGMGRARVLRSVQLPLALPTIAAGIRTAAVQVVATVPLAALVGGGGLGVIIVTGMANQNYGKALAGGVLVAVLCLSLEGLSALVQRAITPKPLRVSTRTG